MDNRVKVGLIVILFVGLGIFLLAGYLSSFSDVAMATAEDEPFTLIGTPPGTKNVLVYSFSHRGPTSATYTCFLVITQIAADISCP